MGGGSKSTAYQTQQHNYNTTGGAIDFTNLLGNLNYKSGGSISTTNTQSFTQMLDNTNKNDSTGNAGSGGTLDLGASVGVGVGGNGSGGQVDKKSSYTGDAGAFSGGAGNSGLSNKAIIIGGAVAISAALALALIRRK